MLRSSSPVEEKEDKVEVVVNGANLCEPPFVCFRIRKNYTLTKCHRDVRIYCLLKNVLRKIYTTQLQKTYLVHSARELILKIIKKYTQYIQLLIPRKILFITI
jgi:hypothetical protein